MYSLSSPSASWLPSLALVRITLDLSSLNSLSAFFFFGNVWLEGSDLLKTHNFSSHLISFPLIEFLQGLFYYGYVLSIERILWSNGEIGPMGKWMFVGLCGRVWEVFFTIHSNVAVVAVVANGVVVVTLTFVQFQRFYFWML